jgi:hypothetical protein
MAIQSPIVLASGFFSQLFPGDTVPGTDTTAQASGNAALVRANTALASGNAGLVSASNRVPISGGYMTGQLFAASGVVVSGTLSRNGFNVVTVGDVETVTSTMIASGTIIDADVNISGAINATKLNFLQAGASGVARTVDSKLKDTVSVKDFGAVGDGVADDTAAIQAAVDVIKISGGTVYFPTGKYKLNGVAGADSYVNGILINWPGTSGFYGSRFGVRLLGDGKGGSVLLAGSSNMAVVRISRTHCSIEHLRIEGGLTSNPTYSDYPTPPNPPLTNTIGILIGPENLTAITGQISTSYASVINCNIEWCTTGSLVQCGPASSGSYHMTFRQIHYSDNIVGLRYNYPADFNTGAGTLNLSTGQLVDKCQFYYGNCGVYADGVAGLNINSSYFELISDGTSPLAVPTSIYVPAWNAALSYGHNVTFTNTEIECSAGGPRPFDTLDPTTLSINTGWNRTTSIGADLIQVLNGRGQDSSSRKALLRVKQNNSSTGGTIFEVREETAGGVCNAYSSADIYFGGATTNNNYFATSTAKAAIQYNSAGSLTLKADPNNANASSTVVLQVDGTDVFTGYSTLGLYFRSVTTEGNQLSDFDNGTTSVWRTYAVSGGGLGNAAAAAWKVNRNSSTSRSINAEGTINASGADYAEYMQKAGDFTIAKGDICGVTVNGLLTNVFADAISFVVKSTNPSYVGNDTWGGEDIVGPKPNADDVELLAQWEIALQVVRQAVDRIAFAGQIPVNVTDATPGQYIIPIEAAGGGITGIAKNEAELTLIEYIGAVGKVVAIENDGRARIIIKIS